VDINNSYTYTSTFNEIVGGVSTSLNNTLTLAYGVTKWGPKEFIKNYDSVLSVAVPQLNVAVETLEAYGAGGAGTVPTNVNDYPADDYVAMKGIYITTNKPSNAIPTLQWNTINQVTNFGQTTTFNDVNNSSPGGEVDIYFHTNIPPPPPNDIAEIDISLGDTTYYWTKSNTVSGGSTTNSLQYRSAASYTLPSGETPSTIVGIAIASSGWSYYWYSDGTLSAGSTTNASSHEAPKSYSLPAGETISDILSISISKNTSETYVWYKDGTFSVGSTTNFGSISSGNPYTVAAGESINTVVGIGIAGNDSHVYAWYSDKTVSQGTATKFDSYQGTIPASF
jgi:hypothetical protein